MFGPYVLRDDEIFVASLVTKLLPVCIEQLFDLTLLFPDVSYVGFGVRPHSSYFGLTFLVFPEASKNSFS